MADLTEFELRFLNGFANPTLKASLVVKKAAKSFKCSEDEIYEGVASLTESSN